jgi:hypothetical protein
LVENGEVKNIYDGFPLLKERKSSIPPASPAKDLFHCCNAKLAKENVSQFQKLIFVSVK